MTKTILSFIFFLFLTTPPAESGEFIFQEKNASLQGKINYTVIGTYAAGFQKFHGTVFYDEKEKMITQVDVEIDATTIYSRHKILDRIVRSPRLLDVKKYPLIRFQSKDIKRQEENFIVTGTLDMHGTKRILSFVFAAEKPEAPAPDKMILEANGKWIVNRKDFGIIWNPILDQGGIIVGNHMTIDWQTEAVQVR